MSADHALPPEAKPATFEDAKRIFKQVDRVAGEFGYITGLLGSTLLKGQGIDVDLTCVPSIDTHHPAAKVGTAIIKELAKIVYSYEELDEKGQDISLLYLSRSHTMVDVYLVGLPLD